MVRAHAVPPLLVVIVLLPGPASAAETETSSSVALSTTYDTNPRLAAHPKGSVWSYTLAPSYRIGVPDARTHWQLGLGGNFERSTDTTVISNRNDLQMDANVEHASELDTLAFTLGYVQAATRATVDVTDAADTTGLDSTRTTSRAGMTWTHQLSELETLSSALNYRHVHYDTASLVGYDDTVFTQTYARMLDERSTLSSSVTASRYVPVGNRYTRRQRIEPSIAAQFQYSEDLLLNARLGFSTGNGQHSGTYALGMTHAGERLDTRIDLSRTTAPSALGDLTSQNTLQASASYALDEDTRLGMSASLTRYNNGIRGNHRKISGYLARQLDRDWSLSFDYAFQSARLVDDQTAHGSQIGVSLTYSFSNH